MSNALNSPRYLATMISKIPPKNSWAPELVAFDDGSGSFRVSAAATDQLSAALDRSSGRVDG